MTLLPFELRMADTVGRALAPKGALGGVVDDVALGALFQGECDDSPWYGALLLRVSLWLAWLSPLWILWRPRSFGGLDAERRELVLERLLAHRLYTIRMAAMFLKLTVCTLLLADERVFDRLGAYQEKVIVLKRSAS